MSNEPSSVGRREEWLACGAAVLALWLWVIVVGQDLSWDVLNHHLYLPFSLLSGRFATDLFGAGPQSYQNPIGYLPSYALVRSGLPAWAVGSTLALMHSLAAWPLWRLAKRVWGGREQERWWCRAALAMAWVSPIFLLLAGTSSIDPLGNILVLTALMLVLAPASSGRWMACAGLLLGLAFAIKPVYAVFALSIGALLLFRVATQQANWRSFALLVGLALLGALVFMGPWSVWLWRSFGNPVFPLFNHWFGSPFAPQDSIAAGRFLPAGALDLLTRPWRIAQYESFIHTEAIAPDLRPVALMAALGALVVAAVRRRAALKSTELVWQRAEVQLLGFTLLSYLLWMITSGNSRYAIPLFMVSGVLLVRALQLTLPTSAARVVIGVLFVLQTLHYGVGGEHRNGPPVRWATGPFLNVQVPQRLRDEAFLHLSLGTPSFASLAPYLNADGALVNAIGVMSLPMDGPLGAALRQRLERWQGRIRILFIGRAQTGDTQESIEFRARADRFIYRFGLRFDWTDCEALRVVYGAGPDPAAGGKVAGVPLLSCNAVPRTVDDPDYESDRIRAERVFAVLEAQCPKVFGPRPMVTNGDLNAWRRNYMNSDARVMVSFKDGVSVSYFRSWKLIPLGSVDDVIAGRGVPACRAWADLEIE